MFASNTDGLLKIQKFKQSEPIQIKKVGIGAPKRWLTKGLNDLAYTPFASLIYGIIYTVIALTLFTFTYKTPIYASAIITLFYILGPIIAVGLYSISRHREAGIELNFPQSTAAIFHNPIGIISFSVLIGLLVVFWTIITAVITAIFFNNTLVDVNNLKATVLVQPNIEIYLTIMGIITLCFAIISFMISAISIPILMHRKTDIVTAVIASSKAVLKNPIPMTIWAISIVLLIIIPSFTVVGLVVSLPTIGHASWHAYRELVIDNRPMTAEENKIPSLKFSKKKL